MVRHMIHRGPAGAGTDGGFLMHLAVGRFGASATPRLVDLGPEHEILADPRARYTHELVAAARALSVPR